MSHPSLHLLYLQDTEGYKGLASIKRLFSLKFMCSSCPKLLTVKHVELTFCRRSSCPDRNNLFSWSIELSMSLNTFRAVMAASLSFSFNSSMRILHDSTKSFFLSMSCRRLIKLIKLDHAECAKKVIYDIAPCLCLLLICQLAPDCQRLRSKRQMDGGFISRLDNFL